jgi:uncharacterized protein
LKFDIKDIGLGGLHVERDLGEEEVRSLLAPTELMEAPTEASLDVTLTRLEDGTVVACGALAAGFAVTCGRCLGPAAVRVEEQDLRLTFLPPARGTAEREAGLDDVDTFSYDGEEVDLGDAVRELLLLGIPLAPLCHPDCRGICSGCGADLNLEGCRCARREIAETKDETKDETKPWAAALQRLKDMR